MTRSGLIMIGVCLLGIVLGACGLGGGEKHSTGVNGALPTGVEGAQDVLAAPTCTPTNYTSTFFRTSSGSACVYGSFSTTCANQISVNIGEYSGTTKLRGNGSGYRPNTATTGRLCAWACLASPKTTYSYKRDLWDLGGPKVTGGPQAYSTNWPVYTSTQYPDSGVCTPSPAIPN